MIWDEFSSLGAEEDTSLMRVFFKYPALRYAWLLSLFSLLLFVLYNIKRKQRIIPVAEPLKNTTVEFVKIVGQVYYRQYDHADIARKKITYLLDYIRTHYNLKMDEPNADFARILAEKAGVDAVLVSGLVMQIARVYRYNIVSTSDLAELNKSIESFYKKTG